MRTLLTFAVITAIVWAGDSGRIYVYAQRPTAARSWLPITCGGVAVAELKEGKFFAIDISPGRHALSTEMGVPASVDVRSGEETFVRLDWSYQADRPPIPELHIVAPDRARKEMMYLSYIDVKKVLSPSVPRTDPRDPALRLKRRSGP